MLYKFKYPKITLLFISVILAYVIFTNPQTQGFVSGLKDLNYIGIFIAGLLFPFGFTAAFSAGFFLTLNSENIILSGFIGALGATISNLLIFGLVRYSFKEEFLSLEKDMNKIKIVRKVEKAFKDGLNGKIRHYLMYVFIGFIIVSPISDEIADALLAGFTKIKPIILAVLSFVLGFAGIVFLLWI